MGRYEEAVLRFNRAFEMQPDLLAAMFRRGRAYEAMGRHEEVCDLRICMHVHESFAPRSFTRQRIFPLIFAGGTPCCSRPRVILNFDLALYKGAQGL